MTTGYISIGSNIDRDKNIPSSLNAIKQLFGDIIVSSVYETAPVGFDGDNFYNLIVGFQSQLEAKAIAKQLKQIELDHGRTHNSQKFSSRTLDLDLVLYGDQIIHEGRLQIPRDEIEHYAFVLEPLAEVAGASQHPVSKKNYADMWRQFDKSGLQQKKIKVDWLSV